MAGVNITSHKPCEISSERTRQRINGIDIRPPLQRLMR
jgi:hypothetical protein